MVNDYEKATAFNEYFSMSFTRDYGVLPPLAESHSIKEPFSEIQFSDTYQ